ncbi:MAG: MFS transporter [Proteobacteria bacterium]|nr:MFS transporter [Pseudomonadota bacterium]
MPSPDAVPDAAVCSPDPSELRRHWPAVAACFAVAVFSWGFGFYGQSVYLAALQRLHGWPSSTIAAATTTFYLAGAAFLTQTHRIAARLGPRRMLGGAVAVLGAGAILFAASQTPWHLYVGAVVMGAGWACGSSTAIATTLALWFDRQRGLAISLALNGASAAGFTVAPLLVMLGRHMALLPSVALVVVAMVALLLPMIGFGLRAAPRAATAAGAARQGGSLEALRDPHFWTVALPFALALMAQVGFIVHMVAFVSPVLGGPGTALAVSLTAAAAMAGRLGLGTVVDRLDQRRAAAASFASQAAGIGLMLAAPASPAALYAGCLIFGLSVGNVITFPALIVQREFPPQAFGLIVGLGNAVSQTTFAFGPAVLGMLRDATGGYAAALILCIVLQIAAAASVLRRPSGLTPVPARVM